MFVPGADRGPDDERAERDERASVAAPGGIEGAGRSTAAELHPDAEQEGAGDDRQRQRADVAANRVGEDGEGPMGPTRMLLEKPVLAAVEGFAVAGGLELSLWCDLRIAARDAVFGVFCRRWGVPLIDGGTVRLPRMIGHSHALDLILTGRGVSGEEALRMGLANRLVEPGEAVAAACELGRELAAFPQRCMRGDRLSSYEQWALELDDAIANEFERGVDTIASGETRAGATRFASGEGRHGSFSD
jgi:enoyl-CoA hydratase